MNGGAVHSTGRKADTATTSDGWSSFHQREALTTRIHNVLSEYPAGLGPFKEFLQNADDAKARTFALVLDERSHALQGTQKETESLAEWLGPALLVYNSAVFTDDDFNNIVKLGSSDKNDDPTRIGKYGLGFNVCYHFSDLVSFVSRDQLVIFDPHGTNLGGPLGLRANFLTQNTLEREPGRTRPFVSTTFGCSMCTPLEGTLLRLALRGPEQAARSLLSSAVYSIEDVRQLLGELARAASSLLLFLKHVEVLEVYRWAPNEPEPRRLFRVAVENVTETLRQERALLNSVASTSTQLQTRPAARATYKLKIVSTRSEEFIESDKGTLEGHQMWVVHSGTGSKEYEKLETEINQLQWGGVAACLGSKYAEKESSTSEWDPIHGRAYCFLPLPISTGLPAHINAFFALSSNRRSLWTGNDGEVGVGDLKARWNGAILKDTVANLYGEMLEVAARSGASSSSVYALWPSMENVKAPFDILATSIAHGVKNNQLRLFWKQCGQEWIPLDEAMFEDDQTRERCGPLLRRVLDTLGIQLVDPPEHVRTTLKRARVPFKVASALVITKALRTSSTKLTTQEAEELLHYVLVTNDPTPEMIDLLLGLSCVPLVGGQVGILLGRDQKQFIASIEHYYISPQQFQDLLPGFPFFVDSQSPSYPKLSSEKCLGATNIMPLSPEVVAHNLHYAFPKHWHGASCLPFPTSPGQLFKGSNHDRKQAKSDAKGLETSHLGLESDNPVWKTTRKRSKKTSAKASKKLQNSINEDTSAVDFACIGQRLHLLWEFIEECPKWKNSDSKLFVGWPVVHTEQGYVMSIDYAKQRVALRMCDFPKDKRDALEKWGCIFAVDASDSMTKLSNLLGTTAMDSCKALAASYDPIEVKNQESLQDLRTLLLDWHYSKEVFIDPISIRALPLFRTIQGTFVHLHSSNPPIAAPGDSDEPEDSVSEWDRSLGSIFPDRLLSFETKDDRCLLRLANFKRLPEARFIAEFLFHHLDVLSQDATVKLLSAVARMKPWNNKSLAKRLLHPLHMTPIIVLSSGQRKLCNEFTDPTDTILCQILGDEVMRLPECYHSKEIMKVMKYAGLVNLRSAQGFILAAQKVAASQSAIHGQMLLDALVKLHQHPAVSWTENEYQTIRSLAWVPVLDVRKAMIPDPSVIPMPTLLTFGRTVERRKKEKRGPQAQKRSKSKSIHSMLEEELQGEFDAQEDYDEDSQFNTNTIETLSNALELLALATVATSNHTPTTLTSFRNPTCLNVSAWLAWCSCLVLPPVFDVASRDLLTRLGVKHPPCMDNLLDHLLLYTSKWNSSTNTSKKISMVKGGILLSATAITQQLSRNPHEVTTVQKALQNAPIWLMDDGSFALANEVVFDLEKDLSNNARAPPDYLLPFEDLFKAIGSGVQGVFVPVKVVAENPFVHLLENLQSSFNQPALSDVQFCVGSRTIYAHKIVLGLASPVFLAMFSSGMQESVTNVLSSGTTITLPEWVLEDAMFILLQYLYTGEVAGQMFNFEAIISEESIDIALCMLRLADQYMLDHLKQWCEKYLSDPTVAHLQNVCSLLHIAEACNAKQLKEMCFFHIHSMFKVVTQMDQWKQLSPELQSEAMRWKG